LGVRRIREFNLALLRKWCWMMHVGKDSLWFKVLAARYCLERGMMREADFVGSMWWNQLQVVRRGDGL